MSEQNNNTRKIDPEKITAERLNGYAALFGCIALIGAYATTGQIIPGFV
ncbi:high light inducible protein [Prochlorococcus marinus]|nr:high light inducible protein [Prochlorococcus marinus]